MSTPETTIPAPHPASAPSSVRAEGRPRPLVVVAVAAVLIVSIALPLVFLPISEDVTGAHTAFHIIGIVTCIAGVYVLHLLRRGATRTVTVMSWIATVFTVGWMIGHIGELFTVFTEGGVEHDSETFDHATHIFFANIAVPSWMLTVLSYLALLIAIGIQAIVRRSRAARR